MRYDDEHREMEICALVLLWVIMMLFAMMLGAFSGADSHRAFAAGTSKDVPVYVVGDPIPAEYMYGPPKEDAAGPVEGTRAIAVKRLVRGTSVTTVPEMKTVGGTVYVKVREDLPAGTVISAKDRFAMTQTYIRADNIAMSPADAVRETEVYVRTPATIYAEGSGPSIASFAQKGSCLSVTGYDCLEDDGNVHRYRIAYQTKDGEPAEGYVYGKYMTDTQEKADAVYNGNGVYDRVKKDKYGTDLHGGKAWHLDYYPYEKPRMEGNEFCEDARAMYLNCAAAVKPDKYIELINDTDCNAVVVDIKDGVLAYRSETARELSPYSYSTAYASTEEYRQGIEKLRETGVYLIGRIVVFNDPLYAKDHPEDCIKYEGSTYWPSAYSRDVWEYNVRLALEAVEEFGFNEIQFDYVRFPENSYSMSNSGAKFRNKYDEEKGQAIQNFCFYAADQLHEAGAYVSVDVFGESAYGYMTAYGQYWPGISNIVDAISAMPYTDHTGGEGAWKDPYGTMNSWAKRAKDKQDYLEYPAAARTWITGYDTPYWAPTEDYGAEALGAQIKGLEDAGLTGGFIPWNVTNNISKYRQYCSIWNAE